MSARDADYILVDGRGEFNPARGVRDCVCLNPSANWKRVSKFHPRVHFSIYEALGAVF